MWNIREINERIIIMKKKLLALVCIAAMVFSLAACGSKSETPAEAPAPAEEPAEAPAETPDAEPAEAEGTEGATDITIGVSFGQNVHPFFVAMQMGIEAACKDNGIENVNILAADSSLETQVSQIENLVTMGCDVILLNPYDSDGVKNAVDAALEKGVGIFTMDIDCEGSTAYVASNNVKVGELLGQWIVEQLNGEGKIAIIDGISVTSLKDRTDGFMKAIEGSNIEVVAEQQTAVERDDALASAETILQAHPDIDAFVGVNENSGMAILSAVTAAGLEDVLMTCVDATAETMAAIRDGKVDVGVSQDPYQMGYTAVEQAIKWKNGETVEEFVEVPVDYMNKDNIQSLIEREQGYGVEVE